MKIAVVWQILAKISGGSKWPPLGVYVDQNISVFPGLKLTLQVCLNRIHWLPSNFELYWSCGSVIDNVLFSTWKILFTQPTYILFDQRAGVYDNETVVSLDKPTRQSGTYQAHMSSYAVDGHPATCCIAVACTTAYTCDGSNTGDKSFAWWQVDLGSNYIVTSVAITSSLHENSRYIACYSSAITECQGYFLLSFWNRIYCKVARDFLSLYCMM